MPKKGGFLKALLYPKRGFSEDRYDNGWVFSGISIPKGGYLEDMEFISSKSMRNLGQKL